MRHGPFRVQCDVLFVGVAARPTFSGGLANGGLVVELRAQWFEDVLSSGTIRHCSLDAQPALKKGAVRWATGRYGPRSGCARTPSPPFQVPSSHSSKTLSTALLSDSLKHHTADLH